MPSASQLIPSARNLLAQALAFAGNRAPSWATGDRDFLGKVARMFTAHFNDEGAALRQLDADWTNQARSPYSATQRRLDYQTEQAATVFWSPNQQPEAWASFRAHQARRSRFLRRLSGQTVRPSFRFDQAQAPTWCQALLLIPGKSASRLTL